jgi:hypothetical protein
LSLSPQLPLNRTREIKIHCCYNVQTCHLESFCRPSHSSLQSNRDILVVSSAPDVLGLSDFFIASSDLPKQNTCSRRIPICFFKCIGMLHRWLRHWRNKGGGLGLASISNKRIDLYWGCIVMQSYCKWHF